MDEQTVRQAANVATDLIKTIPESIAASAWGRIFDAMLYAPIPFTNNMTATGVEISEAGTAEKETP